MITLLDNVTDCEYETNSCLLNVFKDFMSNVIIFTVYIFILIRYCSHNSVLLYDWLFFSLNKMITFTTPGRNLSNNEYIIEGIINHYIFRKFGRIDPEKSRPRAATTGSNIFPSKHGVRDWMSCTGAVVYEAATLSHFIFSSDWRVVARQRLIRRFQLVSDQENVLVRATVQHVLYQGRSGQYRQHVVEHCLLKHRVIEASKVRQSHRP